MSHSSDMYMSIIKMVNIQNIVSGIIYSSFKSALTAISQIDSSI